MTSPITARYTLPTARCGISACSYARPTGAACGSSPSWCWHTPRTSTRGSSGPGWPSRGRCTGTSTSGVTRPTASPAPASSFRISKRRTGHSIRSLRLTSGTASTRISRASTTTTRRCDRPCSTWSTSGSPWVWTACASMRCPTSTRGRARRARTFRRPSPSCASSGPMSTRGSRTACCWPRPTNGPRMPWRTWATAIPATWPSISRSCPGCSWRPARRTGSRWWTSWPRRRPRHRSASGRCSCATTTS